MKQLDDFINEIKLKCYPDGSHIPFEDKGLYLILNMNDLSKPSLLKILDDINYEIECAEGLESFVDLLEVWKEQKSLIEEHLKNE